MNTWIKRTTVAGLTALALAAGGIAASSPASAYTYRHDPSWYLHHHAYRYHPYGHPYYGYYPSLGGAVAGVVGGITAGVLGYPYYGYYPDYYGDYPDYPGYYP